MPMEILIIHEEVVISGANIAKDLTIIVKIAGSCTGSHKIGRTTKETGVLLRTREDSRLHKNLETRLVRIC